MQSPCNNVLTTETKRLTGSNINKEGFLRIHFQAVQTIIVPRVQQSSQHWEHVSVDQEAESLGQIQVEGTSTKTHPSASHTLQLVPTFQNSTTIRDQMYTHELVGTTDAL